MLKRLRIKYFWIFITDRCNLKCDYCFYKSRDGLSNINLDIVNTLTDRLPNLKDAEIVISGGEPFLEWDLTRELYGNLKCKFNKPVLIQTNGTLLDKTKIKFLKDENIVLEFGLDGVLATNRRHRIGISVYYKRIVCILQSLKKMNLKLFSTMTVKPLETINMFSNYKYLINNLGFAKIEITPAAFEKWRGRDVDVFKEEYKKVINYAVNHNCLGSISVEYDKLMKYPAIDIISLPDGSIMTNWALLRIPKAKRAKFSLARVNKNSITINRRFLEGNIKKYIELFGRGNATYRDYSNFHVNLVNREIFKENPEEWSDNYIEVGNFLKRINQEVLSVNEINKKLIHI